jgi:alginate O-acetyltransferase complex protein AlgI
MLSELLGLGCLVIYPFLSDTICMPFNSLEFLLFFGTFILLFQGMRSHLMLTQIFIAVFSFAFYLISEPAYFPHLLFLSLMNFAFAQAIYRLPEQKKLLLSVILFLDVAFLIGGKIQGMETKHFPLGISFFTFQVMSYVLDVYRAKTPVAQGLWHFQSYMFFFPHLIAGPICRANGLMKQMAKPFATPTFEQVRSGFYLISFGLFKKAVLADTIATRVNDVFHTPAGTQGPLAWSVVMMAYGWQIYFDFSGYTDMARGMGKLIGLNIPMNFSFPYFARTLQEFWRRWHMTLSEWFRDFVYIPLGGSKSATAHYVSAIMITFLLSAMWHGLGWNFFFWGLWHALWLIVFKYCLKNFPSRLQQAVTLFVVFFGWFFFRSQDLQQIKEIFSLMLSSSATGSNVFYTFRFLIILSAVCVLTELSAFHFRLRYRQLNKIFPDVIWIAVTLCALIFQAPLKEFIYARF